MPQGALKTSRPISSFLLGLAGAVAVVIAHVAGVDHRVELHTLDLRFKYISRAKDPGDIVHVDIDDGSLREFGRWPWPRQHVARVVDVLKECGARSVVVDVILPEPQEVRYVDAAGEIYGGRDEAIIQKADPQPVFDDAILAETIRACPDLCLAMHFHIPKGHKAAVQDRVAKLLVAHPRLGVQEAAAGLNYSPEEVEAAWPAAMQDAVDMHAGRILENAPRTDFQDVLAEMKARGISDDRQTVEKAYLRHRAVAELQRFVIPDSQVSGHPALHAKMVPPLLTFCQAARVVGFVNMIPDEDGVVRRIPLLHRGEGKVYAQFALAVARHELARRHGGRCTITADAASVTVTCADGTQRVIPVDPDGMMLIHWLRSGAAGQDTATSGGLRHIPIGAVANVWRQREALEQLRDLAHAVRVQFVVLCRGEMPTEALDELYWGLPKLDQRMEKATLARVAAERERQRAVLYRPSSAPDLNELLELRDREEALYAEKRAAVRKLVEAVRKPGNLDAFLGKPAGSTTRPAKPDDDEIKQYRRARDAALEKMARLDALAAEIRDGQTKAESLVAKLRPMVAGKICMIGSTATGAADFVPTPVDPRTPGVVVHSTIIDTVLRGRFVYQSDPATNILVIMAAGVVVSLAAATRGVREAGLILAIVAVGYTLLNALVLFGYWNVWLVMVAPIGAMLASFLLITAYRQLTEERAKRQIKDLFAHAMSPALVDRMLEDPSMAEIGGQKRTLSCMFTDLAGFTSLSERLGPQDTVRVLNRYFDRVTEIIQDRRGGYLNKFLGDGIIVFFGAPVFQEDHPSRALDAAVDCQAELAELNEALGRDFGQEVKLAVRIGIATGEAMVGNCGSTRRMDYTAIGDCINLAARLEAANKPFHTKILVDQPTWEFSRRDDLIARPLGGVTVAGFQEPVPILEVVRRAEGAPPELISAMADFAKAMDRFAQRDFAATQELLVGVLKILPGDGPSRMYLDLCRKGLAGATGDLRPEYKKPEENPHLGSDRGAR